MHQMRISTNQILSVVLRPKKVGNPKNCEKCERTEEDQKLCHEIEPNPSKDRAMHEGDNPLFWDELIKFYFLSWQFIYIRIFKQVPKYLATGL